MGWYLWHYTEQRVMLANDSRKVVDMVREISADKANLTVVDAGGLAWLQMTEQD